MHLHPHLHSEIARETETRRIAEARDASIGASRRRQVTHPHEGPVRGVVARLLAATLRLGAS
jgi:hypothetical protein